ncbi:MAG: Kelch repeat-containing protein, partial [Candidatus Methylomirabilales bacterium]
MSLRLTRMLVAGSLLLALPAALLAAPLTGRWERRAPMRTARSEVAAAALGGRLYVVGGFGSGGAVVDEYDPPADAWRERAALPAPVHHPAAASLDGVLYVIGGYRNGWAPVADVFAYDPRSDRWTRRAPMPTPRGALAAAVLEGRIYAVGGIAPDGGSRTLEVYDPQADR